MTRKESDEKGVLAVAPHHGGEMCRRSRHSPFQRMQMSEPSEGGGMVVAQARRRSPGAGWVG